jgi:hypothetical protein
MPPLQFSNSPIHPRAHTSRDAKRPSCASITAQRGRGECRVPDAPVAARGVVNTRVSHHGYTGSPGIPARNGFNGFLRALPGDRAFLSPSPAESGVSGPLGLTSPSTDLTPASGRQDHTTSPSAGLRIRQGAAHVHRIPPRVRDDREPPLRWDETGAR